MSAMKIKFVASGMKFSINRHTPGGNVQLCYLGRIDDPVDQFVTWLCDDETEALDMVEAIIDPDRDPCREFNERHWENLRWNK
jgi:hypothetical protein